MGKADKVDTKQTKEGKMCVGGQKSMCQSLEYSLQSFAHKISL